MTYGGLYREAYLEVLPKQHIDTVFVHTALGNDTSATLNLEIALNAFFKPMTVHVELASVQDDKTVALGPIAINSQETTHIFQVASVQLWSLDTPNLYYLRLKEESGELLKEIRFGFRRIEVVRDGIFLNGERIKIRGLNRHQSYPYAGYAMPKSAQVLDEDILKWELGVNSVRTSHYPQSHHFVDRCDELGLLVFMEIPGWQHIGDSEWQSIAVNQVSEMVVQYRNHPSIFLWGVRINESQDNTEFYTATNKKVHELDPTRVTGGVRYTRKSELLEDVYTFNDFYHSGDNAGIQPKKKVTSNRNAPYLVTEFNGHMYPTKSFDDEGHRLEHALRHARVLDALYESNEVLGGLCICVSAKRKACP
ncbi:glycoside hydrolase family 2 protein [Fusibacter tunisiensis]|uniref:glycoside hydrolase family 2 protein n=1 Tax=Fusibacter tunisiensis TaxID=1008308 RepID=UPI00195D8C86|nr:glycoside hydrolase family 2 TIM barrel-domain containing protein [Fusibacter tunisiensis]